MGVEAGILSALRMETLLTLPAAALPFCWATKESAALVLLIVADCGLAGLPCAAEAAPEATLGVGRSLRARPECFRESLALGGACEPLSRLAQGGGYIQGAVRAETARASAERVDTQVGMRRKRRSGSRARVR